MAAGRNTFFKNSKVKIFAYYYFSVLQYVIVLSLFISTIFFLFEIVDENAIPEQELTTALLSLLVIMPTYGTVGGIFLYHRFREHEYYLYYNKGIHISSLIVFTFAANILLSVCIQWIISFITGRNLIS